MKRVLLILNAIAMVALFSAVGHGLTLSSTAQVDHVAMTRLMIALGLPFAIGLTRGPFGIWDAIVAIACQVSALVMLGPWLVDSLAHGPGGARALVIVTGLGLAVAVVGLVLAMRTVPKSQAPTEIAPPV